jgi:peptidyl-prolyl cis-trans isomerase SurA
VRVPVVAGRRAVRAGSNVRVKLRAGALGLRLGALLLLGLAGVGTSATARAEVIERVAAIVNDQALLLSELRRRAAPFIEPALDGATTANEREKRLDQLYSRLLQQLVDEELVEQAAKKNHVGVEGAEIEAAIQNVRQQNGMTEDRFWEAVRAQGYNEAQYRMDVRKQLLRLKVLNQRVRSRINITDQTVRDAYDDRLRNARRTQRFRAAHVYLPLPASASATEVARVMNEAIELRKKLTVANFDETTKQAGGGELGWLDQGDLPAVLEEALLGINEGEIGMPVRGPSGVHVFLVRERQSGATTLPEFEQVRAQLERELLDKSMQRQEELFIKGLRRDAVIELKL